MATRKMFKKIAAALLAAAVINSSVGVPVFAYQQGTYQVIDDLSYINAPVLDTNVAVTGPETEYVFPQLTKPEQDIYRALQNMFAQGYLYCSFGLFGDQFFNGNQWNTDAGYNDQVFFVALAALQADHPEYTFLRWKGAEPYSSFLTESGIMINGLFLWGETFTACAQNTVPQQPAVNAWLRNAKDQVQGFTGSTAQVAFQIAKMVGMQTVYSNTGGDMDAYEGSIYGVAAGRAKCNGMSLAVAYLLHTRGIRAVARTLTDPYHAYVAVEIDGSWCVLDPTALTRDDITMEQAYTVLDTNIGYIGDRTNDPELPADIHYLLPVMPNTSVVPADAVQGQNDAQVQTGAQVQTENPAKEKPLVIEPKEIPKKQARGSMLVDSDAKGTVGKRVVPLFSVSFLKAIGGPDPGEAYTGYWGLVLLRKTQGGLTIQDF